MSGLLIILAIVYLAGLVCIGVSWNQYLNDEEQREKFRRESDPFGLMDMYPAPFAIVVALVVVFWPISIPMIMVMVKRMDRDGE